ncbi:hypothetical protein PILCRDRAFT_822719 [Piloderma croceum F 1598]|uniref:Uncharacterized protein n=1 Tax=Piloderma croceum (strain F 1598) TaxID=765440 RepID=A0A0C3F6E9_PILCF|nr:hypothetical protein PILCRDRAFT_822719 [Piloderma croceum F 1598]
MSFAIVTYPPPPPTSNTLTSQERKQFVRSTKKMGKVLGSMPHLIDGSHKTDPVLLSLTIPSSPDKPRLEIIDSPPSDCRHKRPGSGSSYSSMSSESTDARSSLSSSRSVSSYTESINSADSWRVRKPIRKPPPLLRLSASTVAEGPPSAIASVKPTLETIPASPPFEPTAGDKPCVSQHPSTTSFAAFGPPRPPSFEIPSETTLRWAKMERLKRKLGDGVPAKLVFPADDVESLRSNHSAHERPIASGSRPSTRATTESPSMHTTKSSFSLERPLFAIVEGPDDHVSGCFDFGSKREKVTVARGHGRRRG